MCFHNYPTRANRDFAPVDDLSLALALELSRACWRMLHNTYVYNVVLPPFSRLPASRLPHPPHVRDKITGKSSANVTHDLFLHVVGHVSVPRRPCTPGVCVTFALEFAVLPSRTHCVCTTVARGCGGGCARPARTLCVRDVSTGGPPNNVTHKPFLASRARATSATCTNGARVTLAP